VLEPSPVINEVHGDRKAAGLRVDPVNICALDAEVVDAPAIALAQAERAAALP
jgi:hypothetical protein